jgi:hypothetical protein
MPTTNEIEMKKKTIAYKEPSSLKTTDNDKTS